MSAEARAPGKTTFLNALSNYIPKDERIITIEDSAELQIEGVPNLVRLEARNANVEGTGEITIRDLLKTALRMRPTRIIVGEVRGSEAIEKTKYGLAEEPIVLGEGEYFVLGDNRNNSADSRDASVGVVKREEIIGRAWLRIWPFRVLWHAVRFVTKENEEQQPCLLHSCHAEPNFRLSHYLQVHFSRMLPG